ncbi:MAG: hypothetical protein P8182_12255 [Deltaproteobacteria bacterium]
MMKRLALLSLSMLIAFGLLISSAQSGSIPAPYPGPVHLKGYPASKAKPRRFYGYVPPPPIRHTWPGGYRVILQEMNNTFIEHMLNQY